MKTLTKLIIISSILILNILETRAQQYKREVGYVTSTTTTYSIPEKTDIHVLGDLDLIQMQKEPAKEECKILVDHNNKITTINTYLNAPRFQNDFTNEVGKRICDEQGMTLLDHHGNILRHPTDTDNVNVFPLSDREIEQLGIYNELFDQNPRDIFNRFLQDGFRANFDSRRGVIKAEMQNILTIIDFRNYIVEIIAYDGRVVDNSISTFYKRVNGYYIPTMRIRTNYKEINGIRVERVENCVYQNYYVIDKRGKKMVDFSQKVINPNTKELIMQEYNESENPFMLSIYPNPVDHQITITVMDGEKEMAEITLFDMSYKKLITRKIETGIPVEIDVSFLPSGNYILYCRSGKNEESQKIIKK